MRIGSITVGCVLSLVAATALAQQARTQIDRSFTTTSDDCSGLQWSGEMLRQYPDIGSACQEIVERDGKKYVKFEATVRRAHDRGRELDLDIRNGGRVHLRPEGTMSITINGRPTRVADLRQGDRLTFYVPEDRVVAHFYEEDRTPVTATAEAVTVPMSPMPVAEQQEDERMSAALPATATTLPLLALLGMLSVGFGAVLTFFRVRRG